jgi:hypothetical protein
MSAKIEVEEIGADEFRVRVVEGKSETSHRVKLKAADYERIASGKTDRAELVRRSFEFLLENEPKDSILPSFDLTLISRYFPAYEREIRRRLAAS